MKTILILCALLLWPAGHGVILAETRNIYIGDIITLSISGDFSAEALRGLFWPFEIVEITDAADGPLVSIRTFEIGEHIIRIGNKDIVITVESTLNDIQRDAVFEGGAGVLEPGFLFHWRVVFYIAACVFFLSCAIACFNILKKKKTKEPTPLQTFLQRSGALAATDESYFVNLTLYFKEYLERLYQFRIIGKTSTEIINELRNALIPADILPEIQEWLIECDRLKFTGVNVTPETMREHYNKLLKIAGKLEVTA